MTDKKKDRERYERYKAQGLCTQCRKPVVPGKTMCRECLDKLKERAKRYRERERGN